MMDEYDISILKGDLENLWDEAHEQLEGQLLSVHVSYCHDTDAEIYHSRIIHLWYDSYIQALIDMGRIWGISLEHMKEDIS